MNKGSFTLRCGLGKKYKNCRFLARKPSAAGGLAVPVVCSEKARDGGFNPGDEEHQVGFSPQIPA